MSERFDGAIIAVRARFKGKELMRAMGYKNSKAFAAALLGIGGLCPDCGTELTVEADEWRCSCGCSQSEFERRRNSANDRTGTEAH